MAQVGIVKEISGVAKAVSSDGSVRVLVIGDTVGEGDLIVTIGSGSSIKLSFDSGKELTLGSEERALLDESVYAQEAFDNAEVQVAQETILNAGELPTEATAAGDTTAADGGFNAAYVAGRTDGRGDVSSYNLGTDGPVSPDVDAGYFDPQNTAPDAVDDDVVAYENVLFSGNLFDNDSDDGLPNPPADLDIVSVNGIGDTNGDGFITIPTAYGVLNVNVETGAYEYLSNYDPLAFGENVEESFEYIVTDGQLTDTATLNITLNGTNDQPQAEALTDTGWLLKVSSQSDEEEEGPSDIPQVFALESSVGVDAINNFIATGPGSVVVADALDPSEEPTDGSALKLSVLVQAGETVNFNWTFFDAEGEGQISYNDFSFVVIDGQEIQLLASAFDVGAVNEGVFSYTFGDAGVHEITFGVMNEDDTAVSPSLQVIHSSGGEIVNVQTIGIVEDSGLNYETSDTDETDTSGDDIIANDESLSVLSGSLIATDVDASDTHIFRLVDIADESAISVSYDSGNEETSEGSEVQILVTSADVDVSELDIQGITLFNNDQGDRASNFEIRGDFGALGVGESATVTFQFVADDMQGFGEGELPNEPSTSEIQTVTMTIMGTNDQPVVEDVSITQNEVLDGLNTFEGTLDSVSDDDVNDTHTYEMVGDLEVDSPVDVSIESFVLNPDGSYVLVGDFNALAVGESAVMTFQYVANDGHGFDGDSLNENSVSEVQTVTFTVSGTNDQPVVSDISLGQSSISDVVTFENDEDIRIPTVGTAGTVYSSIEITDTGMISDLNVHINLTHTWDGDLNISLRAPDGTIVSLSSYNGGSANNYTNTTFDDEAATSITVGSAPFSGVFRPEGDLSVLDGMDMSGTWTLIISDDAGLDAGMLYNWSLELSVDNQQYIYESHDNDAYQNGLIDTQDDTVTTFSGSLATAIDDDVNDTHEYFIVTDSQSVESADIDPNLITELGVVVNPDGTYVLEGNFNALGVGERATVTFDYYAQDSAQGGLYDGTDGINESSTSEPATVTIIITGTNDQPIVEDVSVTVTEASLEDILYPANGQEGSYEGESDQDMNVIEDYSYAGQLTVSDDDVNDMGLHTFEWDPASVKLSLTTSNAIILDLIAQHGVSPMEAESFVESLTQGFIDFSYVDANADNTMESATLSTTVALPEGLVSALIDMGVFVIDVQEDGSYTVASPLFNLLGANDSLTVDFNYRADDTRGMDGSDNVNEDSVSEWATLSLTVEGTNDQPVAFPYVTSARESSLSDVDINGDQVIDEDSRFEGALPGAQEYAHDLYPLMGRLFSGMDEDLLDVVTMKYFKGDAEVLTEQPSDGRYEHVIDPSLTVVQVNEDGTFSIENPTFDNLAVGESATVTFNYYIDDMSDNDTGEAHDTATNPHEATHSEPQSVTVTIMGTNDRPVLNSVTTDTDIRETDLQGLPFTQDEAYPENSYLIGQLSADISDADTNDTHEFVPFGQFMQGQDPAFATLVSNPNGVISGPIQMRLDESGEFRLFNPTFNNLGVGESVQVSFDVQVTDGTADPFGEPAISNTQTVTLTISGTNDQPTVAVVNVLATEALGTDTNTVITGTFLGNDEDTNDNLTYSVHNMDVAPQDGVYLPYYVDGVYMGVVVTAVTLASGSEIDIDDLDLKSLNVVGSNFTLVGNFDTIPNGESLDIQFKYSAQDDSGVGAGNAYDEQDTSSMEVVTVTVTGTNDIPVISYEVGSDVLGLLQEDNILGQVVYGDLDISDPDAGESEFQPFSDNSSPYGTFDVNSNGGWLYTLDNGAAQVLSEGQEVIETYTVYSEDGTRSQDVTIKIYGTNDAPMVANVSAVAGEDHGVDVTLSATDVDGDIVSFTISTEPTHGTLWLGTTQLFAGSVVGATDGSATLNFIPDENWSGDTSFTYSATDDSGAIDVTPAVATINITPIADAPILNASFGIGVYHEPVSSESSLSDGDFDLYAYRDKGDTDYTWFGKTYLDATLGDNHAIISNPDGSGNGVGVTSRFFSFYESNSEGAKVIEQNEAVVIDLKTSVTSADITFKHAANDVIGWEVYDSDHRLVASGETPEYQNDGEHLYTIDPSGNKSFSYIVIHGTSQSGSSQNGFNIKNITTQGCVTQAGYYEYALALSAALVDTDGSETLSSVSLSNLPEDVSVFANGIEISDVDGVYTVELTDAITVQSETPVDLSSVVTSITSTEQFDLDAPNDTADDSAITTVVEGDLSGLIDMGEGNDTVYIGGDIEDTASITMGAGDDTLTLSGEVDAAATIDFGAGEDTLILDGVTTIDLSNLENLEVVALKNTTLTDISAEDVFNINDSHTLSITGDGTSSIDTTGWVFESSNADVSIYSAVYNSTTVTLEIDNDLTII